MDRESCKTIQKLPKPTVVRLNLTVTDVLFDHLTKIIRERGYVGPSDYFQARIRQDASLEPAHD